MQAHFWTLWPHVSHGLLQSSVTADQLQWTISNDKNLPVRLRAKLSCEQNASTLVVLLHGLGGNADSIYMQRAAAVAQRLGKSTLRLSLRGAELDGDDVHHAAFLSDVSAVLSQPQFDRFSKVALVGYSLGGHIALHAAVQPPDPRIVAVAAICPPLNLEAGQKAFDRCPLPYRYYVMRRLQRIRNQLIRSGRYPEIRKLSGIRTVRLWDSETIVPRFGFRSVDDYYAQASIHTKLNRVQLPTWILHASDDPMIPKQVIKPYVPANNPLLLHHWSVRGGHVGFPYDLQLGYSKQTGLEAQYLGWIESALT